MKLLRYVFLATLVATSPVYGWDGFDWERGDYVEIGKRQLVRPGRTIEIFDYSDLDYKEVEVESVRSYGSHVEVEVFDPETGEYRTFEMKRRSKRRW